MTIAITCGDPAGIGPEIFVKAWQALHRDIPMMWIGDPAHLPEGIAWTTTPTPDTIHVHPIQFEGMLVAGTPTLSHAIQIVRAIETAVDLVTSGQCSAMTTAPINKKVLADGCGFAFPGHTEFLGNLGGVDRVVMMLASDHLRVVPATVHIPVSQVPTAFTPDLLADTIEITYHALQNQFGITAPRLAVAGLNPHAGEGGRMGHEEQLWIDDIIRRFQSSGMNIRGPLPADTMFHAKARQTYDAAICAYHDQALIPIKTIDFENGVNTTLGLPFVRTSPDHGTAYDIAGQGIADPSSMIAAIKMAHKMSRP